MTNTTENEDLDSKETPVIEETVKVSVPPVIAKYTRPPAFQQQNSFGRGNQNNNGNKPVIRKGAGRGR